MAAQIHWVRYCIVLCELVIRLKGIIVLSQKYNPWRLAGNPIDFFFVFDAPPV